MEKKIKMIKAISVNINDKLIQLATDLKRANLWTSIMKDTIFELTTNRLLPEHLWTAVQDELDGQIELLQQFKNLLNFDSDSSKVSVVVEHISLKRLKKKLWQYEDHKPKRVELAVMDYLRAKGWQGYFTEHFDFDQIILIMMCWCNRPGYFKETRKLLPYYTIKDYFDYAADGFWDFGNHKLSYKHLIQNATTFSIKSIPIIYDALQKRGVKSLAIGYPDDKNVNSISQAATDFNAEILISFFEARGGLQYYLDYLNCFYRSELQELKNRCRLLNHKIKEVNGSFALRELTLTVGSYLQVVSALDKEQKDKGISLWIDQIHDLHENEFKDEMMSLAKDIQSYWRKYSHDQSRWDQRALLDLVVWKDRVVSVEVKAPNDRLKSHQKEQLKLDAINGIKSWVVEVHDGKIDYSRAQKHRLILFDDQLAHEQLEKKTRLNKSNPTAQLPSTWQVGLECYTKYIKSNSSMTVNKDLIFDGFRLGQWVSIQKLKYSRNELNIENIRSLNELGFIWNANDHTWFIRYNSYINYIKETGTTQVPKGLIFEDFDLSKWVSKQREAFSNDSIKLDRKHLLNELSFVWHPSTGVHNTLGKSLITKAIKSTSTSKVTLQKMPWKT